jgi:hypothetical protein
LRHAATVPFRIGIIFGAGLTARSPLGTKNLAVFGWHVPADDIRARCVTLIPTVPRTLFGRCVTVFTKDGRSFPKEGTGREFIWDFEEEARRIGPITSGLAISEAQFAELIDTCRHLDRFGQAAQKLISLTMRA